METDLIQERRFNYLKRVLKSRKAVGERLSNDKKDIVFGSRTTMQNLSVVLGTFAGASFVVLASPIPHITVLVLLGIVTLAFEVFWIFKYLFERGEHETNQVKILKANVLDPLNRIVTLYMDAENGKITWEQYDKDMRPLNEELKSQHRSGYNVDETEKSYRIDNMPTICTWLTGIGLGLITLGLLIPYFCIY